MALTNAGRNFIAQAIINDSPTFFTNANSRLGIGDSTTAFAVGQTDLQATTNKLRKVMDSTYPQRTNNELTFKSTFTTNEANYAWQEWAVFNAASSGVMLNRKVTNLGTKASGVWSLTVTLQVTIP
jgi:hypothetical protein